MHEVFNRTGAAHCLCLDAESKVQSGAADWRPYLDAYAAARTVLVAKVEDHRHNKTAAEGHHLIGEAVERAGCRIAGLGPLSGYTWFQDAPVFDRLVRACGSSRSSVRELASHVIVNHLNAIYTYFMSSSARLRRDTT